MVKNIMHYILKNISKSENDTVEIAIKLAKRLQKGDVLCLRGDLGTGKTVFARALIRFLSGNSALDVPSPTFTLVQSYETPKAMICHFDLYRIENKEEIYELGWEDALAEDISLVEWPERLESLAPHDRLELLFEPLGADVNKRAITLIPYGTWKKRL